MGASKAFVLHVTGSKRLYNLMFPIKVHPVVFAWILLLPENKEKINNLTPGILNAQQISLGVDPHLHLCCCARKIQSNKLV